MPLDTVESQVSTFLDQYPQFTRFVLAYSGGVDSEVLLHLMHKLLQQRQPRKSLFAVHVHHGLQAAADNWLQHCRCQCERLGVELSLHYLKTSPPKGESIEQWARQQRYRCLTAAADSTDVAVITAHHQDDQAETLLLHLLRGSGPRGLAAMPVLRPLGAGFLARPLLHCSREEILQYAARHGLQWIEDPSNSDERMDRNFLRHQVIPLLQQRWPGIGATLSRSAGHCAMESGLLDVFITEALERLQGGAPGTLSVAALRQQPRALIPVALRYWLQHKGLPCPSSTQLENAIDTVLQAEMKGSPLQRWTGAEFRRYRDDLYAFAPLQNPPSPAALSRESQFCIDGVGEFQLVAEQGRGFVWAQDSAVPLLLRYRRGGERIQLSANGGHQAVKQLCQQWAIPPWQRERLPLLYLGEDLVAVADLATAYTHRAGAEQTGYRLQRRA